MTNATFYLSSQLKWVLIHSVLSMLCYYCLEIGGENDYVYAQSKPTQSEESLLEAWPAWKAKIKVLHKEYLDAALRVHRNRFEIKLTEGRLKYLSEDYRAASMILLDLVESYQGNKRSRTYQDALFYLADSLYHIGNLRTADKLFLQVLQYGRATSKPCALGRLLEISLVLKQTSKVQKYQNQAIQAVHTQPDPNLIYLLGKYSYNIGQYKEAELLWKQIKKNSSIYPQALYFRAVAFLNLKNFKRSLSLFKQVTQIDIDTLRKERQVARDQLIEQPLKNTCTFRSQQEQLQDEKGWTQVLALAQLALARIHYEQDKYEDAIDYYLAIDRNSPSFRDAIKESVWVAIKQGAYHQALRRLDVQLIDQPNMLNDPITRILKAKLLSIVGRFDDANSLFRELKERFEQLKSRTLTPILRKARGQLISYFQKQLSREVTVLNLESLIPKEARFFTQGLLKKSTARSLFVEINILQNDLKQSRKDIKRLKWVLQGPNQAEIFPTLHSGLLHSVELEYSLLQLQRQLNDKGGMLETNEDYKRIRSKRDQLLQIINRLPQNKIAMEEREAKVEHQFMITDLRSHRLSVALRNLQAQWIALNQYLKNHKADQIVGALSPKERKMALQRVKSELSINKKLTQRIQKLSESINLIQLRIGLYDPAFLLEQKQRRALVEQLNLESEWLLNHNRFPPRLLDELETQRETIADFQKRSLELVSRNSRTLKAQVALEEKRMIAYEKRLKRLSKKAQALGGQIVAEVFYHVLQNLNQYILEADAGLLNVFWQQKQSSSKQLGSERSRRRIHLSILKRDMVDVSN